MANNVDLNSLRKTVRAQQGQIKADVNEPGSPVQPPKGEGKKTGVKVATLAGLVLIASAAAAAIAWKAGSRSARNDVTYATEAPSSIPESHVSPVDRLPTISRLSDTSEVLVAQQLVNSFTNPIAVDGKWGAQTDDGISRLRTELGLDDGASVDASLWRAAFMRLKDESVSEGAWSRHRRSLQSVSVPSSLLLVEVDDSIDGQTKWKYFAPEGIDLLRVQLAMSELNPEKTLGGWKFCRSQILENQAGLRRSWWAYKERLLDISITNQDGVVVVEVSEQQPARLDDCSGASVQGGK